MTFCGAGILAEKQPDLLRCCVVCRKHKVVEGGKRRSLWACLQAVYKTQVDKLDSGKSCKARGHGMLDGQAAEGDADDKHKPSRLHAGRPHNKCCVVM